MAKKKNRTVITHDEAMDFARSCLYSDYGQFGEILAALVVLLLNERDNNEDFVIPTSGERHKEWNKYMSERSERN